MGEFIFVIYLFSGLFKLLSSYNPQFSLPVDLTAISAVALFLYLFFKYKSFTINKKSLRVILSFCVFWLWIVISLAYTSSNIPAINKAILIGTDLIPILYISLDKDFNIKRFLRLFGAIIILCTAIFLPLFFMLLKIGYGEEMHLFTTGYLSIGLYLGIILIVNLTSNSFELLRGKYNLLINFILMGAILALGARGPLAILIASYLLYIAYKCMSPQNYVIAKWKINGMIFFKNKIK